MAKDPEKQHEKGHEHATPKHAHGTPTHGQEPAAAPTARATGEPISGGGPFLFADPRPSPDDISFDATADSGIRSKMKQAEPFPATPADRSALALADIIGATAEGAIRAAGHLLFHCVGDTGGVKSPEHQFLVADKMEEDFTRPEAADRPAFFYHLGDVVYYFGQKRFYLDQFYDPYRHYPAPIFAIPGNHDGDVYPGEGTPSLQGFLDNFCTPEAVHSDDAGDFARTTMTQPGVYFTLIAPFLRIIGLYSNALESPGVISSEGGKYPIGDEQVDFLIDQFKAADQARQGGEKCAVIVAVHHPPFSGDSEHGGSPGMVADLDRAMTAAKFIPDAVVSGHAHIYERFTRTMSGRQIPYLVIGTGGYPNLVSLQRPKNNQHAKVPLRGKAKGNTPSDHALEYYAQHRWGYMRLYVTEQYLTGEFYATPRDGNLTSPAERLDAFTVDLATHKLTAIQTIGSSVQKF